MKNRFIVMAFTFILMIALTPLVFGKLMNAKFNKMLQQLQQKGIELKEIKDKSSYLQTDRVFEVTIPGKDLNSPEIEYVKAVVEAKFKNLPVTTADFEGVIKEIKTKNFDNQTLNEIIKDKIRFFVTTPNFKVYNYKIYDTSFNLNGAVLSVKNTKGVFVYPVKNSFEIAVIEIKGKSRPFVITVKNFKSEYEKKQNEVLNSNSFNIEGDFQKTKFALKGFESKSVVFFSASKINGVSDISFDSFNFANMLEIQNTKLNLKFKDLDEKTVKEIQKAKDENEKQQLLLALISKGFKFDAKLDIEDIKYSGKKLGFLNLKADVNIKPTKNIEEKIQNKEYDFVNFDIDLKTSPQIATMLVLIEPRLAAVLQSAKNTKNGIEITLKKVGDKVYLNGKEIKSY